MTVVRELLRSIVLEDRGHDTPCWLWQPWCNPDGYGQIKIDGRVYGAHRVSYEQYVGPIPDGLTIDHLCRQRACINPTHLEPVTHRENCLRGGGPIPENAAKTHCIHGHPFDEENTYHRHGRRDCRRCVAASQRRYQQRKRAERQAA